MNLKIPDLIHYTTKSPSRYLEGQPEVLNFIQTNSSVECKQVIDLLKKILKDKRSGVHQKLLALNLFHSCMLLKRPDFIQISENRMISLFTRLSSKTPQTLFSDSNDSYENKSHSETFLSNLLNYIYIWANDLTIQGSKKQTEFTKMFYKIREIVNFSKYIRKQEHSKPKLEQSNPNSLQDILNSLEILESMNDPTKEEVGIELIEGLESYMPGLEVILKQSIDDGKKTVTEKIMKVMKRMKKFIRNRSPSKKDSPRENLDIFNSPKVSYSTLEHSELRLQNAELKKLLHEKNQQIDSLASTVDSLQKRMRQLEEAYQKTKDLLQSKEQECAECHTIKDSVRKSCILPSDFSEIFDFAQKNFVSVPIPALASAVSLGLPVPEPEPIDNFKLACCGRSSVLFQNDTVIITFESELLRDSIKFYLNVENISNILLINNEVEVDKSFGFDIKVNDTKLVKLGPGEVIQKVLMIKQICETHLFPSLSLKFDLPDQYAEYIFEIPVSFLSLCQELDFSEERIVNEFELLAFDSESKVLACRHSLRKCRKLLRFSKNLRILNSKTLPRLSNFQLLLAFKLAKPGFVLLSLNPFDQTGQVEVRHEVVSTRKNLLNLITSQIT